MKIQFFFIFKHVLQLFCFEKQKNVFENSCQTYSKSLFYSVSI